MVKPVGLADRTGDAGLANSVAGGGWTSLVPESGSPFLGQRVITARLISYMTRTPQSGVNVSVLTPLHNIELVLNIHLIHVA